MKIYKEENGNYTYEHDGIIVSNLKVVFDKRKGCGDIMLPDNPLGKKWLSESRFKDGVTEIDLENISNSVKSATNQVLKWEEFVVEEDRAIFEEIKARASAKMRKATLEAQIAAQKKLLEAMEAKLNEEA